MSEIESAEEFAESVTSIQSFYMIVPSDLAPLIKERDAAIEAKVRRECADVIIEAVTKDHPVTDVLDWLTGKPTPPEV